MTDLNKILANLKDAPKELTYNQKYHRDTLKKGTALINDNGSVTTALVNGVNIEGKEYNIPFFNNDTGKVMNAREAIDKFLPDIKAGKIKGYDSIEEAGKQANIEHSLMDEEASNSIESIIGSILKR